MNNNEWEIWIDILHIPDLILNLCFYIFFTSYFLYDEQNATMERTTNFRYLKFVKKSKDNFIANRKFTSCYNINKYMLFSLNFAWKGNVLPALKGNNSSKKNNFRIKVRNVQMVYWEGKSQLVVIMKCSQEYTG